MCLYTVFLSEWGDWRKRAFPCLSVSPHQAYEDFFPLVCCSWLSSSLPATDKGLSCWLGWRPDQFHSGSQRLVLTRTWEPLSLMWRFLPRPWKPFFFWQTPLGHVTHMKFLLKGLTLTVGFLCVSLMCHCGCHYHNDIGLRHIAILKLVGIEAPDMGGVLELYPINGKNLLFWSREWNCQMCVASIKKHSSHHVSICIHGSPCYWMLRLHPQTLIHLICFNSKHLSLLLPQV